MNGARTSRVWNFGSVNIDHLYRVVRFVQPGETLPASSYEHGPGGKGLNQSIAIARAGAAVNHIGAIGQEGIWLRELLAAEGVGVDFLRVRQECATGHAVIQVSASGENCILLHPGANYAIDKDDVLTALAGAAPGDRLLIQNETSSVADTIQAAHKRGLEVWFNPAPFTQNVAGYPLRNVDWLVLNEIEGAALSGKKQPAAIIDALKSKGMGRNVVLTRGAAGVLFSDAWQTRAFSAPRVRSVDTTAAGDTFIGYLIAGLVLGMDLPAAFRNAVNAAAVCVTREGAASSIPFQREVIRERRPSRMALSRSKAGAVAPPTQRTRQR